MHGQRQRTLPPHPKAAGRALLAPWPPPASSSLVLSPHWHPSWLGLCLPFRLGLRLAFSASGSSHCGVPGLPSIFPAGRAVCGSPVPPHRSRSPRPPPALQERSPRADSPWPATQPGGIWQTGLIEPHLCPRGNTPPRSPPAAPKGTGKAKTRGAHGPLGPTSTCAPPSPAPGARQRTAPQLQCLSAHRLGRDHAPVPAR